MYYCVPITKQLDLNDLHGLMKYYIKQKIKFALVKENRRYALWRTKFKDETFITNAEDFVTKKNCIAVREKIYEIVTTFGGK